MTPEKIARPKLASSGSKAELLSWVNTTLSLELGRIEQLGNGAVVCQLLDAFIPDTVALHKVSFLAKEDYEVVPNWKQFQAGLSAAQWERDLDVARLSKGSPAECLELLQWMLKALSGRAVTPGYKALARRAHSIKGGTQDVPMPAACNSPQFDVYGHRSVASPASSGRPSYQPSGHGKINVSHVTSKYREGLAPPCLTPGNSRRRLQLLPSATASLRSGASDELPSPDASQLSRQTSSVVQTTMGVQAGEAASSHSSATQTEVYLAGQGSDEAPRLASQPELPQLEGLLDEAPDSPGSSLDGHLSGEAERLATQLKRPGQEGLIAEALFGSPDLSSLGGEEADLPTHFRQPQLDALTDEPEAQGSPGSSLDGHLAGEAALLAEQLHLSGEVASESEQLQISGEAAQLAERLHLSGEAALLEEQMHLRGEAARLADSLHVGDPHQDGMPVSAAMRDDGGFRPGQQLSAGIAGPVQQQLQPLLDDAPVMATNPLADLDSGDEGAGGGLPQHTGAAAAGGMLAAAALVGSTQLATGAPQAVQAAPRAAEPAAQAVLATPHAAATVAPAAAAQQVEPKLTTENVKPLGAPDAGAGWRINAGLDQGMAGQGPSGFPLGAAATGGLAGAGLAAGLAVAASEPRASSPSSTTSSAGNADGIPAYSHSSMSSFGGASGEAGGEALHSHLRAASASSSEGGASGSGGAPASHTRLRSVSSLSSLGMPGAASGVQSPGSGAGSGLIDDEDGLTTLRGVRSRPHSENGMSGSGAALEEGEERGDQAAPGETSGGGRGYGSRGGAGGANGAYGAELSDLQRGSFDDASQGGSEGVEPTAASRASDEDADDAQIGWAAMAAPSASANGDDGDDDNGSGLTDMTDPNDGDLTDPDEDVRLYGEASSGGDAADGAGGDADGAGGGAKAQKWHVYGGDGGLDEQLVGGGAAQGALPASLQAPQAGVKAAGVVEEELRSISGGGSSQSAGGDEDEEEEEELAFERDAVEEEEEEQVLGREEEEEEEEVHALGQAEEEEEEGELVREEDVMYGLGQGPEGEEEEEQEEEEEEDIDGSQQEELALSAAAAGSSLSADLQLSEEQLGAAAEEEEGEAGLHQAQSTDLPHQQGVDAELQLGGGDDQHLPSQGEEEQLASEQSASEQSGSELSGSELLGNEELGGEEGSAEVRGTLPTPPSATLDAVSSATLAGSAAAGVAQADPLLSAAAEQPLPAATAVEQAAVDNETVMGSAPAAVAGALPAAAADTTAAAAAAPVAAVAIPVAAAAVAGADAPAVKAEALLPPQAQVPGAQQAGTTQASVPMHVLLPGMQAVPHTQLPAADGDLQSPSSTPPMLPASIASPGPDDQYDSAQQQSHQPGSPSRSSQQPADGTSSQPPVLGQQTKASRSAQQGVSSTPPTPAPGDVASLSAQAALPAPYTASLPPPALTELEPTLLTSTTLPPPPPASSNTPSDTASAPQPTEPALPIITQPSNVYADPAPPLPPTAVSTRSYRDSSTSTSGITPPTTTPEGVTHLTLTLLSTATMDAVNTADAGVTAGAGAGTAGSVAAGSGTGTPRAGGGQHPGYAPVAGVPKGLLPPDAAALMAVNGPGSGGSEKSSWDAMKTALEVAEDSLLVAARSTASLSSALATAPSTRTSRAPSTRTTAGGAAAGELTGSGDAAAIPRPTRRHARSTLGGASRFGAADADDVLGGGAVSEGGALAAAQLRRRQPAGAGSGSAGGGLELHSQGKLRSVQDGVATLLRHTSQLLVDVNMHCKQSAARAMSSPGAAAEAGGPGAGLAKEYSERAAVLQAEIAVQSHDTHVLAGQLAALAPRTSDLGAAPLHSPRHHPHTQPHQLEDHGGVPLAAAGEGTWHTATDSQGGSTNEAVRNGGTGAVGGSAAGQLEAAGDGGKDEGEEGEDVVVPRRARGWATGSQGEGDDAWGPGEVGDGGEEEEGLEEGGEGGVSCVAAQVWAASSQEAGDVDAALKAVGVAQFSLVQGIYREALDHRWHQWVQQSGAADPPAHQGTPHDLSQAGSAANGATPGRSAPPLAQGRGRAFKLGEYQLKQLRNGDVYKGRRVGSRKEGDGVYLFKNGDVYEGEFRGDRMDGHGVYTFSHEGRYEGCWRGAVYNGAGSETFARGSIYSGEYDSGLRCGWGVCRFYNGDYYEGQWLGGLRHGQGMQQCTDDSNYVGEYCRGKRHGQGVYTFPNGDKYAGQYCDDLPHGYGVYVFAAGQRYEGEWQAGRKHGWSTYSVEDGSQYSAHWQEGKPTWVQPVAQLSRAVAAAGSSSSGSSSGTSAPGAPVEDMLPADQMRLSRSARRTAIKAASLAEQRAVGHWDIQGSVQPLLRAALGAAQDAASKAQGARARALELAQRLDVAVALATQAQAQAVGEARAGQAAAAATAAAAVAVA